MGNPPLDCWLDGRQTRKPWCFLAAQCQSARCCSLCFQPCRTVQHWPPEGEIKPSGMTAGAAKCGGLKHATCSMQHANSIDWGKQKKTAQCVAYIYIYIAWNYMGVGFGNHYIDNFTCAFRKMRNTSSNSRILNDDTWALRRILQSWPPNHCSQSRLAS